MINKYQNYSCYDDYNDIINYLEGNNSYPFKNKKVRLMIINSIDDNLLQVIKEIFLYTNIIINDNYSLIFYVDDYENLMDMLTEISLDLGISFKVNNGIYITKSTKNSSIISYINFVKDYMNISSDYYSDLVTLLQNDLTEYKNYFKEEILPLIIKDTMTKDLVLVYFKNDLNVLKTSKVLYMNRNSLLNKFDLIYKSTGVNLQKFSHASMIYILLLDK